MQCNVHEAKADFSRLELVTTGKRSLSPGTANPTLQAGSGYWDTDFITEDWCRPMPEEGGRGFPRRPVNLVLGGGAPTRNPSAWWDRHVVQRHVVVFPINTRHSAHLENMPDHHRDPMAITEV